MRLSVKTTLLISRPDTEKWSSAHSFLLVLYECFLVKKFYFIRQLLRLQNFHISTKTAQFSNQVEIRNQPKPDYKPFLRQAQDFKRHEKRRRQEILSLNGTEPQLNIFRDSSRGHGDSINVFPVIIRIVVLQFVVKIARLHRSANDALQGICPHEALGRVVRKAANVPASGFLLTWK